MNRAGCLQLGSQLRFSTAPQFLHLIMLVEIIHHCIYLIMSNLLFLLFSRVSALFADCSRVLRPRNFTSPSEAQPCEDPGFLSAGFRFFPALNLFMRRRLLNYQTPSLGVSSLLPSSALGRVSILVGSIRDGVFKTAT